MEHSFGCVGGGVGGVWVEWNAGVCIGDYVRNKALTITGEIAAIDAGQAWIRQDKHHVTVNLSDLESAPKPLQVGDDVKDPDGFWQNGTIVLIQNDEACVDYGNKIGLVVEDLDRLERA